MTHLTETYHWKQQAVINKFDELLVELEMVAFAIEGDVEDVYELSKQAALQGMETLAQRMEDYYESKKEEIIERFPTYDYSSRYQIKISGEPVGELISFDQLVGFDYRNEWLDVTDYRGKELAHAILEPPYNIKIEIDAELNSKDYYAIKTKKYTEIYRLFLDDFLLFSEFQQSDFVIYRWSDDWSNFFEAGKEWWGTYFWTVYNRKNNTIMVFGASETD